MSGVSLGRQRAGCRGLGRPRSASAAHRVVGSRERASAVRRGVSRRRVPAVWGTLLATLVLVPALPPLRSDAHTVLVTASPAPRTTVRRPPVRVTLAFSERLEPAYSALSVWSAGAARVDGGDARIGHDARSIAVSLRAVAPGTYTVRYRVVSIDGHVTEGDFPFTVGPPASP